MLNAARAGDYTSNDTDSALTWHTRPTSPSQRLEDRPTTTYLASYELADRRSTSLGTNVRGGVNTQTALTVYNDGTKRHEAALQAVRNRVGFRYVEAIAGRRVATILNERGESSFFLSEGRVLKVGYVEVKLTGNFRNITVATGIRRRAYVLLSASHPTYDVVTSRVANRAGAFDARVSYVSERRKGGTIELTWLAIG